jgi:release factor glutamine methyltransferase
MTSKQALSRARELLVANGIADAALEAELLLRHVLGVGRVQLYQGLDRELDPEQEGSFRQVVERRLSHEPTAYLTGHCEFYGLDFYIDPKALIPRPESELLVEEALKFAQESPERGDLLIAETGTGSGTIAISLALHLPAAKIYAIDVSANALEVATINCRKHLVEDRVQLVPGDLLEPIPRPVDLVIANLPYVSDNEIDKLSPEIRLFEPRVALAGGEDGLDKIRRLCQQAVDRLRDTGCLLVEVGMGQADTVTAYLRNLFPSARAEIILDLSGIARVVRLRLTPNPA